MAQTRRDKLRARASVTSVRDFEFMLREFDRPALVSEGDSWFDYPRSWGASGNIIDHIQSWTRRRASLLRLESNGDEATAMLSSEQRHKLSKVLHTCATKPSLRPVDVLLFSAGGNDVVGEWDLPRFVKRFRPGMTSPEQLFHKRRLNEKVKQIELAYLELLHLRDQYSPHTHVITHTYDDIFPSDVGVQVFGRNLAGPWVKPYLDAAGIPTRLQKPAADYLLGRLRTMLEELAARHSLQRFSVVDTRGSVPRRNQWRNEIHPTSDAFKKVAKRVYAEVRRVLPQLPPPG